MDIPTPKMALAPTTIQFVEACQRLKSTDPTGWGIFFQAYAVLAVGEYKKCVNEAGDASARATAQGRAQFADLLSMVMENCTDLARTARDDLDRKKKVQDEQARNKGTLLG